MLSVKGFRYRLVKRSGLQVARQHGRPRDGLQQRPMRAQPRDERKDEQNFSQTDEHSVNLKRPGATASFFIFP